MSDQKLRNQYDQSRIFGSFTENIKGRASQGDYQYQSYSNMYSQMS